MCLLSAPVTSLFLASTGGGGLVHKQLLQCCAETPESCAGAVVPKSELNKEQECSSYSAAYCFLTTVSYKSRQCYPK